MNTSESALSFVVNKCVNTVFTAVTTASALHNYIVSSNISNFNDLYVPNVYSFVEDSNDELNCTFDSTVLAPNEEATGPLLVLAMVAMGLMIILTIGGNLLVIVAVVASASLRTPTHSLIVNLAVADLLLGITVLPLSASREISGAWLFGPVLCSIWTSLDVLCCTASILSLCGISVDRYIGVSRPLAYSRILTKRRARVLIAVIWALALAISIAPPLGWKEELTAELSDQKECHVNKELGYVIFSACGSFYLPAFVILVLYALVYRAAVRHSHFLHSGSRVTRSDVTLRVHLGSSRHTSTINESVFDGQTLNKSIEAAEGGKR